MSDYAPRQWRDYAALAYPLVLLLTFFLVPFAIMLMISFFHRVPGGFYEPAFELASYARLLSPFFFNLLGFSLGLAAAVEVGS